MANKLTNFSSKFIQTKTILANLCAYYDYCIFSDEHVAMYITCCIYCSFSIRVLVNSSHGYDIVL